MGKTFSRDLGPRAPIRTLQILELAAAASNGFNLTDASERLQIPKTSVLALIKSLVSQGYLMQRRRRYHLGLMTHRLVLLAGRNSFSSSIRPTLEALARDIQESVSFCILDKAHKQVEHVEVVQSEQTIRYVIDAGTMRPLYCSSPGQVLLAHEPPDVIENYLSTIPLSRLTDRTIVDANQLRHRLEQVREDGYVVIHAEMTPEVVGSAVPIVSSSGEVLAALAMGAPESRGLANRDKYLDALLKAATTLSATLDVREQ